MSLWEKLSVIFKREVADVAEGLTRAGQAMDNELARKQRELEAGPEERIDMIMEEQEAGEARFQELTDRVLGGQVNETGTRELAPDPDAAD